MNDFDWQFLIFGYVILGNILEQDAVLAETSNSYQGAFWGRTAADISTEFIDVGQGWERVPDRYALFHINRMEF